MKAKDIMTTRVVAVPPDMTAREIALILITEGISAVPVADENDVPLGIVSEGDLIGRNGEDREARRDWWLSLAAAEKSADILARLGDPAQRLAHQLMTGPVVTIDEETDATEIARLLGTYKIKRVPVLRDGRIVGIVSRADLLRVLAAEQAKPAEPPHESLLGRAFAGLDGHFGPRHADPPASAAPGETHASAADFRHLTEDHERDEARHRDALHQAEIAARERRVAELGAHHVSDQAWEDLLTKAREAAKAGQKDYLLLRFPSQLCSDGGRAINITEPDWPGTLRGQAAELYLRWEKDLKPEGFHLAAQVLDFPGGFPGDVGLFLIWAD